MLFYSSKKSKQAEPSRGSTPIVEEPPATDDDFSEPTVYLDAKSVSDVQELSKKMIAALYNPEDQVASLKVLDEVIAATARSSHASPSSATSRLSGLATFCKRAGLASTTVSKLGKIPRDDLAPALSAKIIRATRSDYERQSEEVLSRVSLLSSDSN